MQSAHSVNSDELAGLEIEQSHLITLLKTKDGSLKSRIIRLAEVMERIYELQGLSDFINQISTEMTRMLTKKQVAIAPWVSEYLPAKYKDMKYSTNVPEEGSASPSHIDSLISLSGNERDVLDQIEQVTNADLFSLYTLSKKLSARMETIATNRNVLLPGHERGREDYRTPKIEPKITELWQAVHWLRESPLKEFEDFVKEFPPPEELEDKWAGGFIEWGMLFKSIVNEKFSLTKSQWISRIKYMIHQSKHGAAVLDEVQTMLCENCWDEKTGQEKPDCNAEMEWDWNSPTKWRCPTCSGTKGRLRGLTREQVGDNKMPILTQAEMLVNNLPGVYECMDFYITDPQKRIYARKIKLGVDLSKKA